MVDKLIITPTATETTPRRRAKDSELTEAPLGPDDVITDCTSDATVDVVEDGFLVYYQEEFAHRGTPVRGKGFEFTLNFVKLLYARAMLGRRVGYSRAVKDVASIPLSYPAEGSSHRGFADTREGLRKDQDVERADLAELIAELDEMRLAEIVVDNYLHDDAPPAHPGPEPADALKQITELEAKVTGFKDQLKKTSDALEVERRCNFADGSVRAAWDVERRIELRTRDVMTECHRNLEADIVQQRGIVTPDELKPLTLKATSELLRRYDASLHSLSGIHTAAHLLVMKKYRNHLYDPVQLKGNKAMWPPRKREEWNVAGDQAFLSRAPLKEANGGTIGLSEIWHQGICQVCHNYFEPEDVSARLLLPPNPHPLPVEADRANN
ncbi:hypothetical protein R1sor_026564 [Riccia sorocarpa]|uniref:Uncharacterized protein n=1 Tax=Riccia sorocarpa TaxID=122646 RepID=A0ABD3GFE6_9MARC